MTRAVKLIIGVRSVLQTVLPDRDLTVTWANAYEHRETLDVENLLRGRANRRATYRT